MQKKRASCAVQQSACATHAPRVPAVRSVRPLLRRLDARWKGAVRDLGRRGGSDAAHALLEPLCGGAPRAGENTLLFLRALVRPANPLHLPRAHRRARLHRVDGAAAATSAAVAAEALHAGAHASSAGSGRVVDRGKRRRSGIAHAFERLLAVDGIGLAAELLASFDRRGLR